MMKMSHLAFAGLFGLLVMLVMGFVAYLSATAETERARVETVEVREELAKARATVGVAVDELAALKETIVLQSARLQDERERTFELEGQLADARRVDCLDAFVLAPAAGRVPQDDSFGALQNDSQGIPSIIQLPAVFCGKNLDVEVYDASTRLPEVDADLPVWDVP